MRLTLLTVLLLVNLITRVAAQTPVKPGDRILRYDWVRPAHDYYRNIITDTSGNMK